jgi:hypothetical protein
MMMNSAQRSAICAPAMSQSAAFDRPSPGVAKKAKGPAYSMASAAAQHSIRTSASAKQPAIHRGRVSSDQKAMRAKLRARPSWIPQLAQTT